MSEVNIPKRPYFVWATEYPEDGAICVTGATPEEAEKKGRELLNADDDPDNPMETSARPVEEADVDDLRERIDRLTYERHLLLTAAQKALLFRADLPVKTGDRIADAIAEATRR